MPRVLANFSARDWTVHFMEQDCRTPVGPWLVLRTEEALLAFLERGTPDSMDEARNILRRWGQGSVYLNLTDAQYAALAGARRRDPRNGYEKLQARAAANLKR